MMIEELLDQQEPLVRVDRLTVRFGSQTILRDISLTIPAGETLVLLGESGCGKTVLMKTLIGLVAPTAGSVYFDGMNIHRLSDRELTRVRLR